MKEDQKIREPLIDELEELHSQNAELKESIIETVSSGCAADEARRYAESIVETVRETLLVLDADLKIVSANRHFYTTFKVTPAETLGCFIYDLGNKQWDIPKLRQLLEEVLPEKEAFDDFEVDHHFREIGRKIMLLNARQIHRKGSGTKMILLAIEDITERKRLEDLLTESEERYRRLFETASDGILLLEKHEGKITHSNPAAEKMLGYPKEETIGKGLQEIGVVLDQGDFQTTMRNLNRIGILNYNDVPITAKTGQHIDTDVYLVDRARLVQCNIRDITKRKRMEGKLREGEERYRALFERSLDLIYVTDFEGRFIDANDAALNRLGYTREEIPSLNFASFLSEDQLLLAVETLQEIRETGIHRSLMEFRLRDRNGGDVYIETRGSTIMSNGIPVGIQSVARDITDRKKAEQHLEETLGSLRRAVGTTIQVMVSTVETRDPYTAGHQARSAGLACAIAAEMGLPRDQIEGIRMAGSIHDIGKLSIPAEILSKPTKLSDIEYRLIQEHPRQGYEILKDVESPWPLAEMVYQHHERMDGSGYPRNLKGEQILMEARILAAADVVEAMASHRPYRPGRGIDAALNEIERNSGIHYDPAVVDACSRLFREKGFILEGT